MEVIVGLVVVLVQLGCTAFLAAKHKTPVPLAQPKKEPPNTDPLHQG